MLLTSKKPRRVDLSSERIIFKQWLKHPSFQALTPDIVRSTWIDNFKFVKEDEESHTRGLRSPQIGALYSLLAHFQNPDDKAIIVMPTGTGKTETMLSALIANCCNRVLVSIPSDSLRSQISRFYNL
ncbi:DEAD/DEAH box helicase family protein [Chitinophaga sancti]|uniref:DEAD/DEAH box helicase family protein n=1 Tax=Chitinophaga sancti TaxID=1004 RepID=UPI001C435BCD